MLPGRWLEAGRPLGNPSTMRHGDGVWPQKIFKLILLIVFILPRKFPTLDRELELDRM